MATCMLASLFSLLGFSSQQCRMVRVCMCNTGSLFNVSWIIHAHQLCTRIVDSPCCRRAEWHPWFSLLQICGVLLVIYTVGPKSKPQIWILPNLGEVCIQIQNRISQLSLEWAKLKLLFRTLPVFRKVQLQPSQLIPTMGWPEPLDLNSPHKILDPNITVWPPSCH